MQSQTDSLDDRLVELETRLAFQDKTVEDLNEVVINQQQQIDQLNQELMLMRKQLRELVSNLEEILGASSH